MSILLDFALSILTILLLVTMDITYCSLLASPVVKQIPMIVITGNHCIALYHGNLLLYRADKQLQNLVLKWMDIMLNHVTKCSALLTVRCCGHISSRHF